MSEDASVNVIISRELADAGCRVVQKDDGSIHIELDGRAIQPDGSFHSVRDNEAMQRAAPPHRGLLIPEWRRAWRLTSVWAAMLLGGLSLVQAEVLPQLQALVPPQRWPWVTAGFAAAIVVLRLLAQPKALNPQAGDRP